MRVNKQIAIVPGTPINAATGTSQTDGIRVRVSRIYVQVQPQSNCGLVYVMDGILNNRVPSVANASDLTAILEAAPDANTPGGSYSDAGDGIDASRTWIDGLHAGDLVTVSYDV